MASNETIRRQQLAASIKSAVATAAVVGTVAGWIAFGNNQATTTGLAGDTQSSSDSQSSLASVNSQSSQSASTNQSSQSASTNQSGVASINSQPASTSSQSASTSSQPASTSSQLGG